MFCPCDTVEMGSKNKEKIKTVVGDENYHKYILAKYGALNLYQGDDRQKSNQSSNSSNLIHSVHVHSFLRLLQSEDVYWIMGECESNPILLFVRVIQYFSSH